MASKIEIPYYIADGYVGGDRPHNFKIDPEDFRGLSRDEIADELETAMRDHFQQHITPELKDEAAAVAAVMAAVAKLPPE